MGKWQDQYEVRKLESCKKDLFDDDNQIGKINSGLDNLAQEFRELISCEFTEQIASKLSDYKFSSAYNDSDLVNAGAYLDKEIARRNQEINIKYGSDGGGSSW